MWLVLFPGGLLNCGVCLASVRAVRFQRGCEQKSKVRLISFVDTTLLVLGEQHFLLDIKHAARNRGLLSPPDAVLVLEKGMG